MTTQKSAFYQDVWKIAVPVGLQSLLQSSFSVIDQIMIGQLGPASIAAIGLAGKFGSIYIYTSSAVFAAAGILVSQYLGQKNEHAIRVSFNRCLGLGLLIALAFLLLGLFWPETIMALYSKDPEVIALSASYLRIYSFSNIFALVSGLLAVLLRCTSQASYPLYGAFAGILVNTLLNWLLIFGVGPFPALGVNGAAIASVASQGAVLLVTWYFCRKKVLNTKALSWPEEEANHTPVMGWSAFLAILAPVVLTEVIWSLGENVYSMVYGRLGTHSVAAYTMTTPLQSLTCGMLSGFSQAAGILIGRDLGRGQFEEARADSWILLRLAFIGSLVLGVLLFVLARPYTWIYNIDEDTRQLTIELLRIFALLLIVKVQNMVLAGGILRSGGRTKFILIIEFVGTWCIGVPVALVTAFVFHWGIAAVYFCLSQEEVIRLLIGFRLFQSRRWMRSL